MTGHVAVVTIDCDQVGGSHQRLERPSRRLFSVLLLGVFIAIVVGTVALIASRGGDRSASQVAAAGDVVDPATAARIAAGPQEGWMPFTSEPGIAGIEVPAGWVRLNKSDMLSGPDGGEPPRVAVFDRPDGVLLGYVYPSLGYVPKEIADSPGFSVSQARIDKYGCDITRTACP